MRRREFLAFIGATAVSPLPAQTQQAGKLPIVGYLGATTALDESQRTAAFVQRLRDLGWIDGRTVAIEVRWAEGRNERFAEIAAEFVQLKVNVIVTAGTAAIMAAKQATSVIPIVFAVAGDPVGTGLVASLARPGGNVTGLSLQATDLIGKRLELLREIIPTLRRLAIMGNIGSPLAVREMREVEELARTLGLEIVRSEIRRAEDITPAIEAIKSRADAIYVVADPLATTNRVRINTSALATSLPTIHGQREQIDAGGLISYGTHFPHLYRRAADHVDKILRGAMPADIPVERPTTFELVINLKTAKILGFAIPPLLLARADEVIE